MTWDAERIDARLESVIGMRLEKARALIQKAAGRKRANALIRRADHQLSAISRAAAKAARNRRISMLCETMIDQRISELRQTISGLRT